jgi:hypothetical protein
MDRRVSLRFPWTDQAVVRRYPTESFGSIAQAVTPLEQAAPEGGTVLVTGGDGCWSVAAEEPVVPSLSLDSFRQVGEV